MTSVYVRLVFPQNDGANLRTVRDMGKSDPQEPLEALLVTT